MIRTGSAGCADGGRSGQSLLSYRFAQAVFPRRHMIVLFEFLIELGEIVKAYGFSNIIDIQAAGRQKTGSFSDADIRTVVIDAESRVMPDYPVDTVPGIVKTVLQIRTGYLPVGREHIVTDTAEQFLLSRST